MIEKIINYLKGVRYSAIVCEQTRNDLGVAVLKFTPDGRCRAVKIEFLKSYPNEDELRSLAYSFCIPFIPGYTKRGRLIHPQGWIWDLGLKRLSYKSAYSDFLKSKQLQYVVKPNAKYRTVI